MVFIIIGIIACLLGLFCVYIISLPLKDNDMLTELKNNYYPILTEEELVEMLERIKNYCILLIILGLVAIIIGIGIAALVK